VRSVSRLSVTPVKGLTLQHSDEVRLDPCGVANNRRFYLVDAGGRLHSAPRMDGPRSLARPRYDAERDWLELTLPDGRVVAGDVALGAAVVTDFWGRPVPGRVVEGPWAAALSTDQPLRLVRADDPYAGCDVHPLTLLSDASVAELARQAGVEAVDPDRFRMLIGLRGCRPHEEDGWNGREVAIGEAVVRALGPVPRCAAPRRNPATGERDLDTLGAIRAYRGARDGRYLDFGVYAEVLRPGRVRVGDPVKPA
jgi:uncharacterized protein YcbX